MKRILAGLAITAMLAGCSSEPESLTEITGVKIVGVGNEFRENKYLVVEKNGQTVKFTVSGDVAQAVREGNIINGKYDEEYHLTDVKVVNLSEQEAPTNDE